MADRERLLATCGHDLKNLLNVLSLNAEISARQDKANAESAANLQRTVNHMDKLISNMLDFARLSVGTFQVAFESRNAAEVIREAVEIFRPLALAKSLSFDARLPSTTLPAKIDSDRIFQVLSNLFSNAITGTPKGGQISVSAAKFDDVVQIAVRDSGRGIPEIDLENIFNPYRQLDRAQPRGLGLGLGSGSSSRNPSCRRTGGKSGRRANSEVEARSSLRFPEWAAFRKGGYQRPSSTPCPIRTRRLRRRERYFLFLAPRAAPRERGALLRLGMGATAVEATF